MKRLVGNCCKKNQNELQKAEQELQENLTQLRSDLGRVYSDVVDKISAISFYAVRLQQIMTDESALRLKMEEEKNKARQLLEQNESQSRLQMLQQQNSKKARITLFVTAVVGLLVGAGTVVMINLLTGH